MAPFVHLSIKRDWPGPSRVSRDEDLRAPIIEIGDDFVAVEGLVGEQRAEFNSLDERRNTDRVEAVVGHQVEADKVSQCIGESQNLGRHASFGAAYGLALSPLFAPWPCR